MEENELLGENRDMVDRLVSSGVLRTPSIRNAFKSIPRHMFVTEGYRQYAYEDFALPTMGDSTISQPTIVAVMLEALSPKEGDKILEIGMGSGYVACLLAACVGKTGKVVTMELDPNVFKFGESNIRKTELSNIIALNRDGANGYPRYAPYDGILYSLGVVSPKELVLEQLKVKGRMVVPIGYGTQVLTLIEKISEKRIIERGLENVVFSMKK